MNVNHTDYEFGVPLRKWQTTTVGSPLQWCLQIGILIGACTSRVPLEQTTGRMAINRFIMLRI